MIIDSSVVAMNATRQYASISQVKQSGTVSQITDGELFEETLELAAGDGKTASDEGASFAMSENMSESSDTSTVQSVDELRAGQAVRASNFLNGDSLEDSIREMKILILQRLMEMFKKSRQGKSTLGEWNLKNGWSSGIGNGFSTLKGLSGMNAAYRGNVFHSNASSSGMSILIGNEGSTGTAVPAVWKKSVGQSAFYAEVENTKYSSTGIVKTADGRQINFNIDVELSRGFCEKNEVYTEQDFVCTDPLVFNFNGNFSANISDQKFLFDIDCDGTEDSVSMTGEGSGFLALDKNGDGSINDGSELFGAASGDGFQDLSEYDGDGNGWIDEADDVFNQLKIWTKDENGNDSLISLKDVGVGAIYLGSADTEFSLNDLTTNETNAVIRKTGVYLMENGDIGTIQHVDFAT